MPPPPIANLDMSSVMSQGSPESQLRGSTGSPEILQTNTAAPDSLMEMLFSGWDPDLPDPQDLNH
jgi:hypothetical protein